MELSTWHFSASALHFALSALILIAFFLVPSNNDKGVVPIFRTTPDTESLSEDKAMIYDVKTTQVGNLSLPLLLCLFAFITCVSHLFNGYRELKRPGSTAGGNNPVRWTEYAVSAPIMIVIIASLSGVRLVSELTLMAVATAVVMYFGQLVETDKSRLGKMLHTGAGWYLYIPIWVLIGYTFFTHINDAKNSDNQNIGEPPSWLWAIFIAEAILFTSFGGLQISSQFFGFPKSNVGTEKAYIGLSFVSKALLILLAFGGLIGTEGSDI